MAGNGMVRHQKSNLPEKRKGGWFNFRWARKEIQAQLYEGADMQGFHLQVPYARPFADVFSAAWVLLVMDGKDRPTAQDFLASPKLKRALSDLVMQAIGLGAKKIPLPMSAKSPLVKQLCDDLINVHAKTVVPAGVRIPHRFDVVFAGGELSNPERKLDATVPMSSPAVLTHKPKV